MPAPIESSTRVVAVVLRWWDGRTTAYGHDASQEGPLGHELTRSDRDGGVGCFRFDRSRDGVFFYRQVH